MEYAVIAFFFGLSAGMVGRIKGSSLVTFDDLGHSPQIQAPERFHEALLKGLEKK